MVLPWGKKGSSITLMIGWTSHVIRLHLKLTTGTKVGNADATEAKVAEVEQCRSGIADGKGR
jgi:hypothetical protein